MFDTVGHAVKFAKEIGEIEVSPADKNVFRIAMAIHIAYVKGQITIANATGYDQNQELDQALKELINEYQAL